MNSMELFKAFGDIDDNLVYDTINSSIQPQNASGAAPVKQPKPNKPQRGGAKAKAIAIGAVAAVLAAAIICLVLYLTGVFGGKQEPIYTGMEISAVDNTSSTSSTGAVSYHYSGDYTGRSDDIDKDKPFGGDSATIEQQTQSTLQVAGAGESMYYADAGDDIYITIKFSNPDSYEILSFIINGEKYTSYMFETGSDLENIIIKVNVGTVGGIIEYTISEIKYVDGTEIKNVTMIGDPVVKCGVRTSDVTYATISNETTTLTSISFTAKIVDLYSLVEYSDGYVKAVLYDGESIVQMVDLEIGTNEVVFDNLSPDTLYQYAVVGYFDNLSGGGTALNYLYTNAVYTPAVVLFDSISITQDSITFGYSWYTGYSGSITSLTLTGGGATLTLSASATSVTDLLSDTTYTLTATYNGTDGETASIALEFTTEAKATPAVEISTLESAQESISYSLSITDTDSVGTKTEVTLSLNGKVVQTLTTSSGTFTGLLSDNTYTLTAVYTYDLNDGTGSHTAEAANTITTLAKATPAVEIEVTDATTSSLTFNVDFTDTDGVGKITAIALYNGSTLVKSESNLNQGEYIYSSLSSYTEYTLKVTYSYDLNDGAGSHTVEQTLAEYTVPSLSISSVLVGNTSAVTEGGTISLTANMNNPDGVTYKSVVVNGETYSVLNISTASTMYVNISNDGQFAGGETTLTITQINCAIGGNTYTVDVSENNAVSVFINGALTVENFIIARYNSATEKYEETNYGFAEEQLYYVISLGNATKYSIESVSISDTLWGNATVYDSGITISDDYQTVYVPVKTEDVVTVLSGITYSNSYVTSKSKSFSISAGYFVALSSNEVVEITTAEQLLDVDDNKYYKLMNDIDLSSYEWVNKGNNMYGVFDGNGHTISGIGAVTDYYDSDLYIGLFSSVNGIVTSLTVNAYYNVILYNTTSGSYSIYAGGLAAILSDGAIHGGILADNVNVTFTAAITLNGTINAVNVGGICGKKVNYYGETIVINSTVKTNISISAKNSNNGEDRYAELIIGGLFGYLNFLDGILEENEVSNTNVTFTAYITLENSSNYTLLLGGIVGYLYSSMSVSDVTVNSNVTVVGELGYSKSNICGIVGDGSGPNLYNTATNMTIYLDSDLYDRFTNEDWYCNFYEYNDPGSGSATIDENCSATITVNKIS